MTNTPIVDLADCTQFRQTLEARPPRIVHGTALLLTGLVVAAVVWAALTRADLIVRGGGRVRPLESPYRLTNPIHGESLSASAGGRVIEVKVHEGDEVKKGDVLVRFDTERLTNEIKRQEQKLRLAEEELAKFTQMGELQTRQFEAARSKAEAERNLLVETLKRNKERQSAEAKEIEVELASARGEEDRLRPLVDSRAVARAELVTAATRRRALENRLDRVRVPAEEGQLVTAGRSLALLERDHAIQQEELNLKRSAKQTEVQSARLELASLTTQRQHAVLRAPVDGVVAWSDVKVGELVPQGKVILEVAEERGFMFEAVVPSEEIGHLKVGMPARVKLDAFDYQKYGAATGTVQFISPDSGVAQPPAGAAAGKAGQSPFYIVRIALEGDQLSRDRFPGKIKLGMAGHVEIVTDQETLLTLLVRKVRRSISLG